GRGRREIERRILTEDRALELPELAARLDPEPVDERAAGRLVGLERLGLAPGAVEHEHQLAAEALAQRLGGDETLELADDVELAAELDVGFDPQLDRRRLQLLEPRDVRLRELLVGELGEGRAAPERERLVEQLGRSGRRRGVCAGAERLEPRLVELVG